ncbi:MAG TPA: glycosyltransferase family 39 protein [Candidatus Binatia bacterium]|nr:glycosyltransferase family 39 protein [Candidatus Binatia bacterium]
MFVLKPWHRAIGVAAFAGVALSVLAWMAWNDPAINFLSRDKRADWIVFPAAVDAHAHWFASLDATFRRQFVLTDRPATARLSVRAMRRVDVKINGAPVSFPPDRNWKRIMTIDVAEQLHAGTNVIEARVFNHNGPPALWLILTTDQLKLRSDRSWEASFAGSSWRQAALAVAPKVPGPGNSIASSERTFDALKKIWTFWIVLVVIACAAAFLWQIRFKESTSLRWEIVLLLVFASLWLLLFWNNNRLLPFHRGFDSKEHLNYINYVQQHRALPLPTEGWEMYQPPLYYLIAAASLSACGQSVDNPTSISILRWLGAFFGIAQFVLVFLSLRLLFPVRTAFIGLLLAAFLPMHLYLAHYVTNEMLAAALATATLYFCLRLLKNDSPRTSQFAWLGLALGGAMLAKATGILLLPVVTATIACKLAHERAPLAISLRNLGLLLAICLVVCGWHYARIWLRFGTPLLGNWDVISGFTWWQDPGYHTVADYLRFGRSLMHPFFSGFAGFADGIYSTLWGDGLCGGTSSLSVAWNEKPLIVGYLWAVIPTALILVGVAVALIQFIRNPSSELFLLFGFSAVIALGLVFMTLKVPSYAQAKAFYGLSALTPLCFFGAVGWETLTRKRRSLQFILGVIVLFWAMSSFATYWIVPSVSQHLYAVKALGTQGKIEQANTEAAKAVQADPSNAAARGFHALGLSELGHDDEAIKEAERATELNPTGSVAHLDLAISVRRTDQERAIAEARHAIQLGPENSSAYQFLMNCLFESHRYNEAADLGHEWLTLTPYDAAAHSALGFAVAENGDLASAAEQLGYVMMLRPEVEQAHAQLRQILLSLAKESDGLQRLRDIAANAPDSPRMLDELAWLLATYPDSKARDGTEAVRLAERACDLTERKIPALLDTLAAAYTEAGDFPRGISTAEEALNRARSFGDNDAVKLSESILASLRENRPYRQEPE